MIREELKGLLKLKRYREVCQRKNGQEALRINPKEGAPVI